MIKVLELFGGIGACSKALERLGIEHEIVDYVEIDKYATKSFNAVHGTSFEPQDITEWNKDIAVDLIMHGSPCQDFSVAGLGKGGDKGSGTRSSLMYETLRIVEKIKPKYVIWENVKNLLSKKHIHNFEAYQEAMRKLGYTNYYQVLNAKDYGVPQNRERVFTVSIRNDVEQKFEFPAKMELEKRLKDILDKEVEEKYYLTDKQTDRLKNSSFNSQRARENALDSVAPTLCARDYKGPQCVRLGGLFDKDGKTHQAGSIYAVGGVSPTLSTMQGGNLEPMIVASRGRNIAGTDKTEQHLEPNTSGTTNTITSVQKDNYVAVVVDSSVKPSVAKNFEREKEQIATTDKEIYQCKCKTAWQDNKVGCKVSPSLRSGNACTYGLTSNYRIRKLTPKECWRLMGFDDSDFEKAEKVNSNSQLYKQAGNSIVVNVLEGILRNLLKGEPKNMHKEDDGLIEQLKNLHGRLVSDYNGWNKFEQLEEDRIAVYDVIEMVETTKELVELMLKEYPTNDGLKQILRCLNGHIDDYDIRERLKKW